MKDYIKGFNEFINERLNNIESITKQLDELGIKYELSNNKYKPIKKIYRPINKSDSFYKKFNDIIFLNNLENVIK